MPNGQKRLSVNASKHSDGFWPSVTSHSTQCATRGRSGEQQSVPGQSRKLIGSAVAAGQVWQQVPLLHATLDHASINLSDGSIMWPCLSRTTPHVDPGHWRSDLRRNLTGITLACSLDAAYQFIDRWSKWMFNNVFVHIKRFSFFFIFQKKHQYYFIFFLLSVLRCLVFRGLFWSLWTI